MANKSIRLRTTPGVNKNIVVKLEQDFDFLEVLSLKLTQENLYQTFCANYGVVVGRVIANKGFGIPNAKVSIFIPVTDEDQKNALINTLYPFKTPFQRDDNGIRYNLLPSKYDCNLNTAVGTFPSKKEVLDNDLILEIFDKYYKYTTRTNSAGDFMLFGVPLGQQTLHIDLDLSDIGIASVRPYDLIAEGSPEKLFASKVEFKKSTNLDALPQIKSADIAVDVIPFWGDLDKCEIGITRADFDTGLELKYTSLFFGSIFTDSGKMALNKGCNPRNDMGEQDKLRTGPGVIKMIRVSEINPTEWVENSKIQPIALENFDIDGGDLIDDNGTFAYQIPMNICHVITDEFGSLVPSPDPTVGIATKGMYRFAISFAEAPFNNKFKTGTMFFPSLGEDFGGTKGKVDTGSDADKNGTQDQRFTTDITQYNYGTIETTSQIKSPEFSDLPQYTKSRINLDFQLFEWKQVYTIAHYIKKYKRGGNRFSFVGIKNTDISDINNLFPYTNAIWKFDILYYIIAAAIDVFAFLLKLLIIIISICFGFCLRLRFRLLGQDVQLLKFCLSICLFKWLGDLIGTINLPGEGCGPDGSDEKPLDLRNCTQNQGYCGYQSGVVTVKPTEGGPNCPPPDSSFNAGFTNTDGENNQCLSSLEDWKCCVKLNVAENRNVIRRVFVDSWVFGTAYLFQFKYKAKINRRTGEIKKEKFCGPGADQRRGDNYKNVSCCLDTQSDNCNRCLVRGTGESRSFNGVSNYHYTFHNTAITNGEVGSVDVNNVIYCNALMSTKIVTLGRIEMCPEILTEIENAIVESSTLDSFTQNPGFYTGTYFERGWENDLWSNTMKESSYEDPRDVLFYLANLDINDCKLRELFETQQGCHEYELKPDNYFFVKEVSKIYNDVIVSEYAQPDYEIFYPQNTINPIANTPALVELDTQTGIYSGFEVDLDLANRFSPCGGGGLLLPPSCVPLHNWDGNGTSTWTDMGSLSTGDYTDISNNNLAFDGITDPNNRNNKNTRSNIPYYYFGLLPGKTAITKLRKNFFFNKQLT